MDCRSWVLSEGNMQCIVVALGITIVVSIIPSIEHNQAFLLTLHEVGPSKHTTLGVGTTLQYSDVRVTVTKRTPRTAVRQTSVCSHGWVQTTPPTYRFTLLALWGGGEGARGRGRGGNHPNGRVILVLKNRVAADGRGEGV